MQIRDINEVSRQEVDEIINMFTWQVCVSSSDNIQKRYSLSFMGKVDQFKVLLGLFLIEFGSAVVQLTFNVKLYICVMQVIVMNIFCL